MKGEEIGANTGGKPQEVVCLRKKRDIKDL